MGVLVPPPSVSAVATISHVKQGGHLPRAWHPLRSCWVWGLERLSRGQCPGWGVERVGAHPFLWGHLLTPAFSAPGRSRPHWAGQPGGGHPHSPSLPPCRAPLGCALDTRCRAPNSGPAVFVTLDIVSLLVRPSQVSPPCTPNPRSDSQPSGAVRDRAPCGPCPVRRRAAPCRARPGGRPPEASLRLPQYLSFYLTFSRLSKAAL